ncbi:54S ribosomal protein L8, mitochondrial [Sphaceloma murrayae]|uniref:Large ribosomal subunit protein bL17m n=1 Tax=Sphaceloma murrayae TaxID=2082308 RepID=A0A2K1QGP1_9PEZI|nr:54S ribosomal protein L8, mitochondrial [Sphaceloma murrayae]
MAGGHMKYRTLGRKSSHRQALLRNLVTALFKHESITTSWAKAKEAQRMADKLVTLGKRNTEAARNKAKGIFFEPSLLPKLFTEIRSRYATRPGGYTRVLRLEPQREDQSPSAILELVDSPRDTRFALTARTLAFQRRRDASAVPNEVTQGNIVKVTRFRPDGEEALEEMVRKFEWLDGKREWAEAQKEQEDKQRFEDNMVGTKPLEVGGRGEKGKWLKEKKEWEGWVVDSSIVEKKERVYPKLARSRMV